MGAEERGCVADQPQRGRNAERHGNHASSAIVRSRCGWSATQPRSEARKSAEILLARFVGLALNCKRQCFMSEGAMIEVANLTKRYAGRTAVANISFTVGRGEIAGLLGPNGAGKSTT